MLGRLTQICAAVLSRVQLFVTLGTAARQAPLSVEFPGKEYWSGLPCPPPGDLYPGIELTSLMSPVLAGGFFTTDATREAHPDMRVENLVKVLLLKYTLSFYF